MEIIGKENIDTAYSINDLEEGDLFLLEGEVCLKIRELEDCHGFTLNAIALETGEWYCIQEDEDEETIIPLNATLKIWKR